MTATTAIQPDVLKVVADLKATTDQKALVDALAFVLTVLPARQRQLPILNGVLLEGGATLTASGFDYELSATDTFAGSGTGRALVNIRMLHDIVKSLDKGCVIELAVVGNRLTVTGDGVTYTLTLLPLDEYPQLPSTAGQKMVCAIGPEQMAGIVDTAIATGREDKLPVLTAVRFEPELNGTSATLLTAATDRYRLTVFDTGVTVSKKMTPFLLPAYVIDKVRKAFKDSTVKMSTNDKGDGNEAVVFFTDGTRTLTARTLDGAFPKFRSLLPDQVNTTVTVNAKALTKGIKQVALVASRTSPVRLTFSTDGVELQAGGLDEAEASKPVPATVDGEPLTTAFNPAYLLDGIAAVGTDMVLIQTTSPTKPAVLVGPDRPEFRYLLMPTRLAG